MKLTLLATDGVAFKYVQSHLMANIKKRAKEAKPKANSRVVLDLLPG